jgi:drug/metabolite transporter (DMT)-like permease
MYTTRNAGLKGYWSSRAVPVSDWLAFTVLCLSWGSTFVALKFGLEGFGPIPLAAWHFLLAGGVLWLIAWVYQIPGLPMRAFKPVVLGTLFLVTNYALVFIAAPFLPSGLTAAFSFATVAFALTISSIVLKLERPRIKTRFGLGMGLIGLLLLAVPRLQGTQFWPIIAVIVGNVAYVMGSLVLRETLRTCGTVSVTIAQMLGGGSILFALSLMLESGTTPVPSPRAIAGLLYLALVGSVVGFSLYQYLLVRWRPGRLAIYNFICPVIALILGALIIHKRPTMLEMIATILMLSGAALSGSSRAS